MRYIVVYFAIAVPFIVIDGIWLTAMMHRLYLPTLGDLARDKPNLWPALAFYLVYPLGLLGLAVMPALQLENMMRAAELGLLFGFFTYATYDLTNYATLRNWSMALTAVDITWGSLLAASCALIGYVVARRLL